MNFSFSEMAFLFVIALIVFGPKKLPEIGRQIGKALAEFKRASNEFKAQIEAEISQLEKPEPQILPPSQPPAGAIAARSMRSEPEVIAQLPEPPAALPEAKAPNA